jgi:hypothetical protein
VAAVSCQMTVYTKFLTPSDYEKLMVAGSSTVFPRMEQIPVTVPFPLSEYGDRIFESQRALTQTYYSSGDKNENI